MIKHILITGEIGAGKSTLIQRLLTHTTRPVYGFITRRMEADASGFHPIYIHPAGALERVYTTGNRIGMCNSQMHGASLEVFNTLGVRYLDAPEDGLIVMDELGFMEAKADLFVQKVFEALDGRIPVIAAVKARLDVPFLNAVRARPNAANFTITPDNRGDLYRQLSAVMDAWASH